MRTISALVFSSFLAVALLGCGSDVPPFWAKLGVTAKGGETRKDMASDQFFVVFYPRDAAQLVSTCKEAYQPIVTAGWTPVVPEPADEGGKVEQVLKSGSDKVSITCTNLSEVKQISVTFRHR
ncbi:hypothetical protein [Polyangium sp. y55x31]|uniref:hypothetical protein n=1 Tax=Polyangium sp. y55x31 TaxID=3042688 RepID=UPI002482F0D8|nr:hypothetical protein [Polyangium sp. y55x31]MDI1479204.1 hypothetical protein [Polyangium sp. y55x31]